MSTAETREPPIDSSGALDKTRIPSTIVQDELQTTKGKRGFQFWMCFASLILPTFLVALDIVCSYSPTTYAAFSHFWPFQTAVSTPLPVIVQQLNGREFEWVGSAYALSATALQPLCGGLAQVSGDCVCINRIRTHEFLGLRSTHRHAHANILFCFGECDLRRSTDSEYPHPWTEWVFIKILTVD